MNMNIAQDRKIEVVNTPAGKRKAGRKPLILAGLTVVAVAALVVQLSLLRNRSALPPLNADTATLAKFVGGDVYAKLPFDQQRQFAYVLEDRDDNGELREAFEAGDLTETQYRAALVEVWLGQQLKRAEKHASLAGDAARARYVQDLSQKKAAKKANPANNVEEARWNAPKVKADSSLQQARIASLPPETRKQWEEFRQAYETEKETRQRVAESTTGKP